MPMSPFQDVALQTPNDKIGWQNYHFNLEIKINGLKYPLPPNSMLIPQIFKPVSHLCLAYINIEEGGEGGLQ